MPPRHAAPRHAARPGPLTVSRWEDKRSVRGDRSPAFRGILARGCNMDAAMGCSLLSFLAEVPDPRSRHGRRHPLTAILALVCCAIMSGAKSYAAIGQWGEDQDIALMHRLGFTRTPPKAGGIRKVLIALNKTRFEQALSRWAESRRGRPVASTPLEAVALDGKSVRG